MSPNRDNWIEFVLIRLPAKSLMRCKLVCKSWNTLISDPSFAESHHVHARTRADASTILFYFLTKNLHSRAIFPTDVEAVCSTQLPVHTFSTFLPCTNVVNGLICLRDDLDKNRIHILNVTTGEQVALPRGNTFFPKGKRSSPDGIIDRKASYFLGFDPSTMNYKLLNLQRIRRDVREDFVPDKCYVLTLGADESWREIRPPIFRLSDNASSLDGKIFWKDIKRRPDGNFIPFFDVEDERFFGHPCPDDAASGVDLVAQIGENLALLSKNRTLWMVRDTHWRKVKLQIPAGSELPFYLEPIGITSRDEILLMLTSNRDPKQPKTLMFYGVEAGMFRSTKIRLPEGEASNELSVFADAAISNHVENIVPLKALMRRGRRAEQNPPYTRQRVTKSVDLSRFLSTITYQPPAQSQNSDSILV